MSSAPQDPGRPYERTGLAWQRTTLAGLACGLLVARLLAGVSLALAVVTGLVTLLATTVLGLVTLRRARRPGLTALGLPPAGDGVAPALISTVIAVSALGALLFALSG